MSQMSNPYTALQRDDIILEREVSVMAIVALVIALVGLVACIIPGVAGLGALLGVASLVIISQSDGRVSGRGIAIASIVIGLMVTIFQISLAVGVRQAMSQANTAFFAPMGSIMADAEKKDLAKIQTMFTKPAADRLTQEHVNAFADAVHGELGAFKGVPDGMVPLIRAYMEVGPLMEQFQRGSNDVIPVPVEFEKGIALLAVQADQTGRNRPGTGVQVPLINAKIITKSGKGFLLFPGTDASADPTDPSNPFPPRPPAPKPTSEATPDTPDAPPTPASEAPAEPTEEPQSP
ncbi:MAG: DUF4190 domain-containing protein [Phycisphaerae bacterium]|jgi:hypothetical protein